jgi:DNA-binding GntR family transcriptional regulator
MTLIANQTFKQVDDTSLRGHVAKNIRQAIAAGLLKPSDRLAETTIPEQMGTSRAPVREAIQLLEEIISSVFRARNHSWLS